MDIKKRSISAVVDVFIIRLMTIVTYCVTVSILSAVHRGICITTKRYIGKMVYLILLYIVVMLCIHFLYFFVSEKKGNSIGKKLAKYEPAYGKTGGRQDVRVALCKTGACVLYVVTVLYFLFTGKMPYDKVRRDEKGTGDNADIHTDEFYSVSPTLSDKEGNYNLKDITTRRAIAFIIDYALFCAVLGLAATGILAITSFLWTENGNMLFTIMFYMIGCGLVLLWVYFFILDYNPKLDSGKRLMKIVILSDNQKLSRSMAFKHSALKMLAGSIWPISFSYYFIKHKMLYDKYLGITIKDKSELEGK